MKKLFLVLLICSAAFVNAQNTFEKFEDRDGIVSFIVNKKMFELMSKMKVDSKDKEMQQYLNLLKKLDNLKVFTTTNSKLSSELEAACLSYLKSNPLDELMRVNNDGKSVKIYTKSVPNSTKVTELLMFVEETGTKTGQTILLSLTGEFDLNELSSLTARMNIPGSDELLKGTKK